MNILRMIFGKNSAEPLDLLNSEDTSPVVDSKPKYWTRHNLNWNGVQEIRVVNDSVYISRIGCDDELIATRIDHRTAMGYADALSRNRSVPIAGQTKTQAA